MIAMHGSVRVGTIWHSSKTESLTLEGTKPDSSLWQFLENYPLHSTVSINSVVVAGKSYHFHFQPWFQISDGHSFLPGSANWFPSKFLFLLFLVIFSFLLSSRTLPHTPITLPSVHIAQGELTFHCDDRCRQEDCIFSPSNPQSPTHLFCVFLLFMMEEVSCQKLNSPRKLCLICSLILSGFTPQIPLFFCHHFILLHWNIPTSI